MSFYHHHPIRVNLVFYNKNKLVNGHIRDLSKIVAWKDPLFPVKCRILWILTKNISVTIHKFDCLFFFFLISNSLQVTDRPEAKTQISL